MSTRTLLFPLACLALLLGAGMVTPAGAASLPEPVLERGYPLRPVGSGDLRWLGRAIYQASLWTTSGRYSGFGPGETVALSLDYQRAFSRDDLVRITDIAWRRLGHLDADQRERWLAELRRTWSDVAPGQNVTTVVVPNGPTYFYDQQGRFGRVEDPQFGPAFLAIWLDPRSVVGELRLRLLGGRDTAGITASN
jgi:hypothetical protein